MYVILQDRCSVVHIPFVLMTKCKFLAKLPVDNLIHPVVSRLLLILWYFFKHSIIMWLMVSSLSPHNLHLLFCCGLSILTLILLVRTALYCAALRRYSFFLKRFPFLSHVHVFLFEMLLISRLKRTWSYLSSHFSSYCHFVGLHVISIVSVSNQLFSVFFYVVFESLYRCVNAVFNAGKSFNSLVPCCMSTSSLGCNN